MTDQFTTSGAAHGETLLPPPSSGHRDNKYQCWLSTFTVPGSRPRPALPIQLAPLSPVTRRRARENANAVVSLTISPEYIRDLALAGIAAGRARAGKTLEAR
jgi:alkanesulfonate monooxygenase SsuD/methylene tetrahydromethanopterin reductase-like flavin-dependent oxidoreductase (luciferase family)